MRSLHNPLYGLLQPTWLVDVWHVLYHMDLPRNIIIQNNLYSRLGYSTFSTVLSSVPDGSEIQVLRGRCGGWPRGDDRRMWPWRGGDRTRVRRSAGHWHSEG